MASGRRGTLSQKFPKPQKGTPKRRDQSEKSIVKIITKCKEQLLIILNDFFKDRQATNQIHKTLLIFRFTEIKNYCVYTTSQEKAVTSQESDDTYRYILIVG